MFGHEVEKAAQAHAIRDFPKESCGVVIDGKYVPVDNVAEDPLEEFQMPSATFALGIEAVIHSHNGTVEKNELGHRVPHHPHWPSAGDMMHQLATDVPWGIISTNGTEASKILWWGEHCLDTPLIGREFIPGIYDCYAIVRSWYHQNRQIDLPEFPRNAEWWTSGENHLLDGFASAGFKLDEYHEEKVGDVVFMRIHSKVPCHCGVISDDYLLLHHLENRLSRREPIGPWRKFITHWLRYDP